LIVVGTYPTRSDAELAQTALTAAGITSEVTSDDAGGAYPFDLSGGARLLVDEADAEAASIILDTDTGTTG
jgi:hypothetical protein